MAATGQRVIEGVPVLPLDGLWQSLEDLPAQDRLVEALAYAGCEFHDAERHFVKGQAVSLAAIGGVPVAGELETDEQIGNRISSTVEGSRTVMGSSANFSYLTGREAEQSYQKVVDLGHTSVAHTVQVSLVAAGISQAAELELSLQRDLVHLSKLTNARTTVQNTPPMVVENREDVPAAKQVFESVSSVAQSLRESGTLDRDRVEFINSLHPTRKATILMISGTLRNFGKLVDFEHDDGKEQEFRQLTIGIKDTLGVLWPELFKLNGEKQ